MKRLQFRYFHSMTDFNVWLEDAELIEIVSIGYDGAEHIHYCYYYIK
jgi:hypothetical protein